MPIKKKKQIVNPKKNNNKCPVNEVWKDGILGEKGDEKLLWVLARIKSIGRVIQSTIILLKW